MAIKKKSSETIGTVVIYALVTLFALSIILVFMNLIAISLSNRFYVQSSAVTFWPRGLTFDAYRFVLVKKSLYTAYLNTIFVVVVGVVTHLIMTCFAAYPLSRSDLVGKKAITLFIAFTMWFHAGMIPAFLLVRTIKLYNTLWALILPGMISAYNVIIVRNFFAEVPSDLEDAARVDGATDARILFQIFIPLSKPVLATVSMWIMVGLWNNYMSALIYIRDSSKYTLQIVLRNIVLTGSEIASDTIASEDDEFNIIGDSIKYAAIVFTTVPILCIYPFLQKYFVKGVIIGAVKG